MKSKKKRKVSPVKLRHRNAKQGAKKSALKKPKRPAVQVIQSAVPGAPAAAQAEAELRLPPSVPEAAPPEPAAAAPALPAPEAAPAKPPVKRSARSVKRTVKRVLIFTGRLLASLLLALLTGVVVWLAATAVWEARGWASLSLDEVLLHFTTSIEGAGNNMLHNYIRLCVLPGGAAMLAMGLVLLWARKKKWFGHLLGAGHFLCLSFLTCLLLYGYDLLDVSGYLGGRRISSDYIESNYVDPQTVELTFPERKRNLIYIWLESTESTFAGPDHGGVFAASPIPNLTRLAEEGVAFTGEQGGVNGGYSLHGATWTMGALFAHSSGLPLKIPVANSQMEYMTDFFPGVTTLGDILAENGYRQALLIGSDATFGGRRLFYEQHGNFELWDYSYSMEHGEIPAGYHVWWGYEDEKLFANAKKHLTELAAGDEPFNLSILTADTHFPDGYACRLCGDSFGKDQYSNVFACADRQVAEFVEWLQAQPFYENTTVVISGDHITMDADYCDNVPADYPRRVYTVILNPAVPVKLNTFRTYSTMDNFPTTLAAMGVKIDGDRLGLGVNLFSRKQTLLERDGLEKLDRELRYQSDLIDSLSGIGGEIYEQSEAFKALDMELEVRLDFNTLVLVVHHLDTLEDRFSRADAFIDKMAGDVKTTVWHCQLTRRDDGTYAVAIPLSELGGMNPFTIHIYAKTENGRLLVDHPYLCDLETMQFTQQPNTDGLSREAPFES